MIDNKLSLKQKGQNTYVESVVVAEDEFELRCKITNGSSKNTKEDGGG